MKWFLVSSTLATLVLLSSRATGALVTEIEPNNSVATAQSIDGSFSLDFSPDIGNLMSNTSTTIPHVTIAGTGNSTVDFYSFTVTTAGSRGIFDVDYALDTQNPDPNFDAWIALFTGGGSFLHSNDDNAITAGQGGSTHPFDSYLEFVFATPGVYAIAVGSFPGLQPIPSGPEYELQVSLENAAVVPEPASLAIWGLGAVGLAGAAYWRRRSNQAGKPQ